jgi:hypothetical protein
MLTKPPAALDPALLGLGEAINDRLKRAAPRG